MGIRRRDNAAMYLFYAISSLIYRVSAIRGRVRVRASVNRANARRQESLCRREDNARTSSKRAPSPLLAASSSTSSSPSSSFEGEGFSRYYELFCFYFARARAHAITRPTRSPKLDILFEAAAKITADGVIDGIIHGLPSTVVESQMGRSAITSPPVRALLTPRS